MQTSRPDIDAIKARLATAPAGALSQDPTGNRLLIDLRHLISYVEEIEEERSAAVLEPAYVEL